MDAAAVVFLIMSLTSFGLMWVYYVGFMRNIGLFLGDPAEYEVYEKPVWAIILALFLLGLILTVA